jgi:hypothetical protein
MAPILHALSSQERDAKANRKLNHTIRRNVGSADVHSTVDCEHHRVRDEGCNVVNTDPNRRRSYGQPSQPIRINRTPNVIIHSVTYHL